MGTELIYGYDRVGMAQVGSEWTNWGRNGPSALNTYLMYLFEARAVGNGYRIFEGRSNMYVTLQTNIKHDKHTSLSTVYSRLQIHGVSSDLLYMLVGKYILYEYIFST